MDTSILRKIGLTESQAKGYLMLVKEGALTPVHLAEKTGETRTNAYAICERLTSLGLVKQIDSKKSSYQATSPTKLKQLLISKQKEIKETADELTGILPGLLSQFRLSNDQPGVLHLEGIESLKLIYDDIIKTGETLMILPAASDRDDSETASMIDSQIKRQRAAGIKTQAVVRPEVFDQFKSNEDELFEVHSVPFDSLEAQIMIFGPNVVFTTYKTGFVSTIITSPLVAQTFKQLFLALWNYPKPSKNTKID